MILVTQNGFSDVQGISDRLLGYVFVLTRDDTIHSYVICFGTMHIFQAFYTGYINVLLGFVTSVNKETALIFIYRFDSKFFLELDHVAHMQSLKRTFWRHHISSV